MGYNGENPIARISNSVAGDTEAPYIKLEVHIDGAMVYVGSRGKDDEEVLRVDYNEGLINDDYHRAKINSIADMVREGLLNIEEIKLKRTRSPKILGRIIPEERA
jgi:hypothetical protein